MMLKENLKLTQEWDKTFPKSEKVEHSKVTFVNRYGITLAADLYVPKNTAGKLPAIAVSGLKGWVDCFEKAELAGSLFCGGISDSGEAAGKKAELEEAYQFGKMLR